MAPANAKAARDVNAELAFLTRALKAPTMREAVPRLAERARTDPVRKVTNWALSGRGFSTEIRDREGGRAA